MYGWFSEYDQTRKSRFPKNSIVICMTYEDNNINEALHHYSIYFNKTIKNGFYNLAYKKKTDNQNKGYKNPYAVDINGDVYDIKIRYGDNEGDMAVPLILFLFYEIQYHERNVYIYAYGKSALLIGKIYDELYNISKYQEPYNNFVDRLHDTYTINQQKKMPKVTYNFTEDNPFLYDIHPNLFVATFDPDVSIRNELNTFQYKFNMGTGFFGMGSIEWEENMKNFIN